MNQDPNITALAALAHAGRMSVFRLLARRAPDTVSAGDLVDALNLKPSTLSVYVGILTRAGLVQQTRHGRFVHYGIDLTLTGSLIDYLVTDCCRGRPELVASLIAQDDPIQPSQDQRRFNVLFVCTGNSARSIFAEAILQAEGAERFRAFSAGTAPYKQMNPLTAEVLKPKGHDISGLFPKDLSVFQDVTAPKMDFVFTVCDRAANEDCPPLLGQPVSAHWGMPDPIKAEGSATDRAVAFQSAYDMMRRRLTTFINLPLASLSRSSLQKELDEIGQDGQLQLT